MANKVGYITKICNLVCRTLLPARYISEKTQLEGLLKGAAVVPSDLRDQEIDSNITGILTSYQDNKQFQFCTACVVWNYSTTQSVYYLGKDRKVTIIYFSFISFNSRFLYMGIYCSLFQLYSI